eukprot:143610-Pleurochrysis_carterae.AAC.1
MPGGSPCGPLWFYVISFWIAHRNRAHARAIAQRRRAALAVRLVPPPLLARRLARLLRLDHTPTYDGV